MAAGELADAVGPVLARADLTDAVVAAIRDENREVTVVDRGGYVRVLAARRCAVSRAAIERHAGHPIRLPGDLEAIMPSFRGQLRLGEEGASWEAHGGAKGA